MVLKGRRSNIKCACVLTLSVTNLGSARMMQSESAHKHSNKESDNHVVQIALLRLIPLVIVLVWIALMYDKLLTNPFLAILLVLGVLVILFGGTIRFGPIKIQKSGGHKSVMTALTFSLAGNKEPCAIQL